MWYDRRFWAELGMYVIVHLAVVAGILFLITWVATASPHTVVRGCVIDVDGTGNNRDEVVYFNCGNQVAFQIESRSVIADIMRSLQGRTVDVKLEVIK